MGVVLPGWADEILDIIGVSWPNVDEDDYREMATAMREFAGDINDGASQAHEAVQALVSSAGGGQAAEALNAHWSKINGTHLAKLAQCGELAATALDGVAVLIEGAKLGAIVQLGILAAEVIAAQAAAPFTFGLSELGALGATQATRVIVKRLFKEVCRQVAEQVVSIALTPVEEALAAMVGDLVVQLGANALGVKDGVDLSQTAKAGKEGFSQGVQGAKDAAKSAADNPMQLLSAGGGGGGGAGGSGGFTFDHDAHDKAVTGLQSAGGHFRTNAGGKIGRAKHHHGRTRGKDAIADAANTMLDKVIDGIEDAVKKSAKHLDDNMTRGVKQMAKNHKENDQKLSSHFSGLGKGGKPHPKGPKGADAGGGGGGGRPPGKGKTGGNGDGARDPWWHGHSADQMRHYRTDPVDVSHLDPKTQLDHLENQARELADKAQKGGQNNPFPGKDYRREGCAGSFLHDGLITAHTSSVQRKISRTPQEIAAGVPVRQPQKHPRAHPALQQVLDGIAGGYRDQGRNVPSNHGKCAEVSLISDRLHQMDPDGTKIRTPEDARRALEGGIMHTRQIGDDVKPSKNPGEEPVSISHGDYKKPCTTCGPMMHALGIVAHR
ncbi:YwqJ-related putative deaminase [Streptomyces sp. NPDC052496]|uniref:WXG100-like domain-containing protein n=1 Tax=Streptomyces sp. NPDC052496 TaxID=3154951 RepID=UPI00342888C7